MHFPTWRPAATLGTFALVIGGWMIGCANGDDSPDLGPEGSPTQPAANGSSAQVPGTQPGFDASFADVEDKPAATDGGGSGGCLDPGDPGSSESTAKALPATSDAQNDPIAVRGTFTSGIDVDYYKLPVSDVAFAITTADIQLKTKGVELCVFVKCPNKTEVTCAGGSTQKSEQGLDGCCTSDVSGGASPSWKCPALVGSNDSATLYVRAKPGAGSAPQCLPYSFSYAF